MYKMKCATPGENVLAQKILFSKGYRWAGGENYLALDRGLYIYMRPHRGGGVLTKTELNREDFYREQPEKEIGFKELMKL